MVTKAVIKKVRMSPRKARVVANYIRGKKIEDALRILKFEPKKVSEFLAKALNLQWPMLRKIKNLEIQNAFILVN